MVLVQTSEDQEFSVGFTRDLWVNSIEIPNAILDIGFRCWWSNGFEFSKTIAKDAPDDDLTIAEDAFMMEKIRWLTENTQEAEQAFMDKMVEAKEKKARALIDWISLQRCLKTFRNMDHYVKKNVEKVYDSVMQAKQRGEDMDACLMGVKKVICNMCDTVEKVIEPYKKALNCPTFLTCITKLRNVGKMKSTTSACTICFDDNKPLRCPYCSVEVCFSCMERWWSENACKIQMTMPCCKRSAWGCLTLFRPKSKRYQTVIRMLNNTVLEEEKAKKYKYVAFVENKKHAESLEEQIVTINDEIFDCRSKIRHLSDEKVKLRSSVGKKLLTIEYPGCLAACFDLCPIDIPLRNPCKVTMVPEIPSALFERKHGNAHAILTAYPKWFLSERIIEYSMRLRLQLLAQKPLEFVFVSVMFKNLATNIFGDGTSRSSYGVVLCDGDSHSERFRSIGKMLSSVLNSEYFKSESLLYYKRIMSDCRKRQRTDSN